MIPGFSRPLRSPPRSSSWTAQDVRVTALSDTTSLFISMTELLSAERLPCPDPMSVLHAGDERYDVRHMGNRAMRLVSRLTQCFCSLTGRESDWTHLLTDAESLEYVSPDVDACLAEYRALEAADELDLTGNEFLQSPPILDNLDMLEQVMAEKFVPVSPVTLPQFKPSPSRREQLCNVGLMRCLRVASLTTEGALEQELAERDCETSQTPSARILERLLNLALTTLPDRKRSDKQSRSTQAHCSLTVSTTIIKTAGVTTLATIVRAAARVGPSERPAAKQEPQVPFDTRSIHQSGHEKQQQWLHVAATPHESPRTA